jgi:hypothetical protein
MNYDLMSGMTSSEESKSIPCHTPKQALQQFPAVHPSMRDIVQQQSPTTL